MSQQINTSWVLQTIGKISSIIFMGISVYSAIGALRLLGFSDALFKSQQNVAEDEAHGIDVIGGLLTGGMGIVWLAISVIVFFISLLIFVLILKRSNKKPSQKQQTQVVQPNIKKS